MRRANVATMLLGIFVVAGFLVIYCDRVVLQELHPRSAVSRLKDEDGACVGGPHHGEKSPGDRFCGEPWYESEQDQRAKKPGWVGGHIAHGIIMTVPFALLFPLGALGHHISFLGPTKVSFHRTCMVVGYSLTWVGLGLGIWLAFVSERMWSGSHQILGTALFCAIPIQMRLGSWLRDQAVVSRKWLWFGHAWYGRILIILGVINAGRGLQMAADWITSGYTAYLACTIVFAGTYFTTVLLLGLQRSVVEKSWEGIGFLGGPRQREAERDEEDDTHTDKSGTDDWELQEAPKLCGGVGLVKHSATDDPAMAMVVIVAQSTDTSTATSLVKDGPGKTWYQ